MKLSYLLSAAGVMFAAEAQPAQAAYVVNMIQSGANVIATGSGSINVAALTGSGNMCSGCGGVRVDTPYIDPSNPTLFLGSGLGDVYYPISIARGFGSSIVSQFASVFTGKPVGFYLTAAHFIALLVPDDYISQTNIGISTSTWNNSTFSSLGVAPGTYKLTWGSGLYADSFTVNIGPVAAVPEPKPWTMMIGGFALAGVSLRRRHRVAVRFA